MASAGSSKPKRVSPYFAFCKKHREEVKRRLSEESCGKPVSAPAMTKALSELWRSLGDSEKQSYKISGATEGMPSGDTGNDQETDEKTCENASEEVMEKDGVAGEEAEEEEEDEEEEEKGGGGEDEEEAFSHCARNEVGLAFPVARVKRIIKLDKDIRVVAGDATILISQASHLFLEHLVELSYEASCRRKHKTIRFDDIMSGIAAQPRVHDFLSHALGDESFHGRQVESKPENNVGDDDEDEDDDDDDEPIDRARVSAVDGDYPKKPKAVKRTPLPEPSAGTRRIADFFAAKPNKPDAVPS